MSKTSRLTGIDLAYLLATLGCITVAFIFIIGDKTHLLNHYHYFPLLDIIPAWFFFLNGMTTTLSFRDSHTSRTKLGTFMTKKGTILFLIGLAFCPVWPLNIFMACGVFYILAPFFATFSNTILRVTATFVALISIGLISFTFIKTNVHYSGFKLQGSGLLDLLSFLFFNGHYSLLPWLFFFMLGLIHGRGHVHIRGMLAPTNLLALIWIVLTVLVQYFSLSFYQDREELYVGSNVFLANKIYMPAFLLLGTATSVLLTNACIYMMSEWPKGKFLKTVQELSSFKYSMFFFQLCIGAITLGVFNLEAFKDKWGIALYCIIAAGIIIWLSLYWKRKINELGPIEWLMKRISGSAKT